MAKKKQSIPDLSDDARNRRLAEHLRSLGLFAVEIYHPDPKRNDEVVAVLVGAATPPKEFVDWIEEKLS